MELGELPLRGVVADELQDLVLESTDVEEFLRELSRYTAGSCRRRDARFFAGSR